MSESANLTKKKRKALQFRGKIDVEHKQKSETKEGNEDVNENKPESGVKRTSTDVESVQGEPPKKRKTRRGKKGKGAANSRGPRFILFVGNLPYDIKQAELVAHFKTANPDVIRIRQDKGIAFLEFEKAKTNIQSQMDLALKLHHSIIRNRTINVELTVGGGGNSDARIEKLKQKNEKLREKMKQEIKKKKVQKGNNNELKDSQQGIHPSRMPLIG